MEPPLQDSAHSEEEGAHRKDGVDVHVADVEEDDTYKGVDRHAEAVDHCRELLLRHVLAPHLHERRPEEPDRRLKDTEGNHLRPRLEAHSTAHMAAVHRAAVGVYAERHRKRDTRHKEDRLHVFLWPKAMAHEDARERGARHASDHEARKHEAVGDVLVVGGQRRGPQEDEGVHGALVQPLHGPEQRDAAVGANEPHRASELLEEACLVPAVAVVLGPRGPDEGGAGEKDQRGRVKGRHKAGPDCLHQEVGGEAAHDGDEAVAKVHGLGEGVA
mmetsp:Transcript_587/g.1327  ORF Transcript_587/g.1327 Transcript_587/m.1327 type:complete len:273 (+) Transcript_587:537-1355(+)